jgi:hypothetical protein
VCDLLQLASPIATIIAAGVVVYFTRQLGKGQLAVATRQADIAAQQARLADVRLQHDLFDRRFEIYEAARNLLLDVFRYNNASHEAVGNLVRATEKAAFIFDQGITDYLAHLRRQAIYLQEAVTMLGDHSGVPRGDERNTAAARRAELSQWFVDRFDILLARFKPFMALDRDTATHAPPPEDERARH